MKILYFDCMSGIAGDMTVGALLDLGLPFDYLKNELDKLNLPDVKVSWRKVEKHKISAVKFDVDVSSDKGHRHLHHVVEIIENSSLTQAVKDISLHAFQLMAEAEARIHDSTPEKVHFHEVGGLDAIVDIVGAAIGVNYFNPDRIYSSVIKFGSGTTRSAHGIIPIPPPASVEILKGITIEMTGLPGERVTPTGASIVASLLDKFGGKNAAFPRFRTVKTGYGAGSRDYEDSPNLLRIFLGENDDMIAYDEDKITILETNIDDINPQVFDHLFKKLYSAGALDVFVIPVMMKKNRPAYLLTVLCKKDLSEQMCDIIFSETPTAGIRIRSQERVILTRTEKTVETEYGQIRVKILKLKDDVKIQPEYDDCSNAAQKAGVPIVKVMEAVRKKAEIEEGRV